MGEHEATDDEATDDEATDDEATDDEGSETEGAAEAGLAAEVSDEERQEIEEERERRLDPDNRPENTQVDNTDEPPQVVQEFDAEQAESDDSDESGESEGGAAAAGLHEEPEDSVIEQIEKEREERLDPDNRPDNAEVDNTQRTFNQETGRFEDDEGIDDEDDAGEG